MSLDPSSGGLVQARLERIRTAERYVGVLRMAAIALNAFIYLVLMDRDGTNPGLAYALIAASTVYGAVAVAVEPWRRMPALSFSVATATADAVFIAAWIGATGGFESPFYLLWFGSLVAVAFRFGILGTLAASVGYSVLYLGLLAGLGEVAGHDADLAARLGYILLVGLLGGLLSRDAVGNAWAKNHFKSRFEDASNERARFENLVEAAPDPIVIVDTVGRIDRVNSESEKTFGYGREELVGQPIGVILPGLQERLSSSGTDYFQDQDASRIPGALEIPARAKNGRKFLAEVSLSPLASNGNRTTTAIIRDLTARRKTEQELAESEQRWNELLRSAPAIIFKVGRDGNVLYVNRPPLPGREEVVGQHVLDLVQPNEKAKVQNVLDRVFKDGQPQKYETTGVGHQGSLSRFRASVIPVVRQGEVVQALLMMVEMANDVRSDSLEQRLAALVQSSEDAIVGLSPEGIITSWNPGAQALYGYTPQDVVGQRLDVIVPGDLMEQERQRFQRIKAGTATHRFETRRQRKDGTGVAVAVTVSPVRDGEGNLVAFSSIAHDLSDRIRAEERRAKDEERVRELEQLREINSFKTQFINTAAHELNTPLTPVRLQLHILKKAVAKGVQIDQKQSLEILDRNVERLSALVQDLLEVARMQSGRLSSHKQYLDLDRVVREALESYQEPARLSGLRLLSGLAGPLHVFADSKRLIQVLYNLLNNAIKFTPEGGRITVETWQEAATAFVRVRDTGRGLTQADIARLFQPFSQVHEPDDRTRGGTGLGLYICRGIVELHGGRIWCESAGLGQGSSFVFALPIATAEVPPETDEAENAVSLRPNAVAERKLQESFTRRIRELI